MPLLKAKLFIKKAWLWDKKFWWLLVLGLGVIVALLLWLLTKNGAYVAGLVDLMEAKRAAHDQEMETLTNIHDTEVAEKNARLEEHFRLRAELEEEFAKRGTTLDKQKEKELKRLIDESYNDPEKLARELARVFGIEENG